MRGGPRILSPSGNRSTTLLELDERSREQTAFTRRGPVGSSVRFTSNAQRERAIFDRLSAKIHPPKTVVYQKSARRLGSTVKKTAFRSWPEKRRPRDLLVRFSGVLEISCTAISPSGPRDLSA